VAWEKPDDGDLKEPVVGRVALRRLNLAGDRQADLGVPAAWTKLFIAIKVRTS
jgi:hypothetical protein